MSLYRREQLITYSTRLMKISTKNSQLFENSLWVFFAENVKYHLECTFCPVLGLSFTKGCLLQKLFCKENKYEKIAVGSFFKKKVFTLYV